MADIPLDFDTLNQYGCFIGSAAIVILSNQDTAARRGAQPDEVLSEESCGQCTPCRVGTVKALRADGASGWDAAAAARSCRRRWLTRRSAGSGQAAPNPTLSVIEVLPAGSHVMRLHAERHGAVVAPRQTKPSDRGRRQRCTASRCRASAYKTGMRADGNCRACMVEITGERVLAPSCCRYPTDGMEVTTDSARAVVEPEDGARAAAVGRRRAPYTLDSELDQLGADALGRQAALRRAASAAAGSVASGDRRAPRRLHPVRPVRARVPRRAGERRHRLRVPRRAREDRVRPRRSDGRLDVRRLRRMRPGVSDRRADAGARCRLRSSPTRQVDSVCPYCGVGCQLTLLTSRTTRSSTCRARTVRRTRAGCASRAATASTTCSTGTASPCRCMRKPGIEKHKDFVVDPDDWRRRVPRREAGTKRSRSRPAVCATSATRTARDRSRGFGSAKGTNEEAYLFQKLVRTGFGSNNVDHCTRLCHASSVAALMEGINSGAVSNQVRDVAKAEGDLRHRRESDRESSGRRDLDEERRARPARS